MAPAWDDLEPTTVQALPRRLILTTHCFTQAPPRSAQAVTVVRHEDFSQRLSSMPEIVYSGDQTARSVTMALN
jgi:hypothetical protein